MSAGVVDRSAVLSDDGRYRYRLSRVVEPRFGSAGTVCFVMLNPSTADAETDDPTIRKCLGFAHRWAFERLDVVNLYAYRSTDPSVLRKLDAAEAVGPENQRYVWETATAADLVVCAWGAAAGALDSLWLLDQELHCLGKNRDGSPKHPLYVPYTKELEVWP